MLKNEYFMEKNAKIASASGLRPRTPDCFRRLTPRCNSYLPLRLYPIRF